MKKFYLLWIPVLLSGICTAQNLVSNGSFESFLNIPNASGQCIEATGWKSSGGSPDYFHQSATVMSGVNIPYTFAGTLPKAHEGQACAGICSYMEGWTNYREYLSYKLNTPMVAGTTYDVSYYVLSNPFPLYYGGLSTDNFGMAMSGTKLHKSTDGVIHYSAQCLETQQLYGFGWKKVSYEFYADSNFKFITIGCFVDDSVQQRYFVDSAQLFQSVYTFIDDVTITPKSATTTGLEELNYAHDPKIIYTDILGRPTSYRKGLLIAREGNKCRKIFVQ